MQQQRQTKGLTWSITALVKLKLPVGQDNCTSTTKAMGGWGFQRSSAFALACSTVYHIQKQRIINCVSNSEQPTRKSHLMILTRTLIKCRHENSWGFRIDNELITRLQHTIWAKDNWHNTESSFWYNHSYPRKNIQLVTSAKVSIIVTCSWHLIPKKIKIKII